MNMDFLVMVLWAAVVAAFDNIRQINYGSLEVSAAVLGIGSKAAENLV